MSSSHCIRNNTSICNRLYSIQYTVYNTSICNRLYSIHPSQHGQHPILYFSVFVCVFVCYRFSRQPLNRLLWNLARCFEMVSERQLTILVSIGCIFNELSHMRYALYWARIRIGTETVTWQWFGFTFINALSSALSDVKHLLIQVLYLFDVNELTGYGRRATGDKISCFDRF